MFIINYGYGRMRLQNAAFSSLSQEKNVKIKNEGKSMPNLNTKYIFKNKVK